MDPLTADTGSGNETAIQAEAESAPDAPATNETPVAPEAAAPSGTEAKHESGNNANPEPEAKEQEPAYLPKDPEVAEVKPEEKPAEDAGESLVLTFPEGFEVDEPKMAAFQGMAKKSNLTKDAAQEMFDFHHQELAENTNRIFQAIEDKKKQLDTAFYKELVADPEVGGDNLVASVNYQEKAIRTIFPDEKERKQFQQVHGSAALNNNKWYVKFMKRVGEMLSEATPETGDVAGESEAKSVAERLYKNVKF